MTAEILPIEDEPKDYDFMFWAKEMLKTQLKNGIIRQHEYDRQLTRLEDE